MCEAYEFSSRNAAEQFKCSMKSSEMALRLYDFIIIVGVLLVNTRDVGDVR